MYQDVGGEFSPGSVALISTLASGRPDRSDLGREYITGKTLMLSDSVKGLAFVFRWCHQPGFSSALLSPRIMCSGTARSGIAQCSQLDLHPLSSKSPHDEGD